MATSFSLVARIAFLLAGYVLVMPAVSRDIREHWIAALSSLYAMNWVRAFNLASPKLLAHTWSLAIEEQFYLIWPVALLAMLARGINLSIAMVENNAPLRKDTLIRSVVHRVAVLLTSRADGRARPRLLIPRKSHAHKS